MEIEQSKNPLSNYEIRGEIGRGSFSIVREAIHIPSGTVVAVKSISKRFISKKGWANLCREIEIMVTVNHPNVLKMHEYIDTPNNVHLILEYVNGGELFEQIVQRGHYGEDDARKIVRQVLKGIEYLHEEKGICHRDLKPENLLCSANDGRVLVADFGLAKMFSRGELLKTHCGTPHYAAPEIVRGDETYDKSVDMWSIGVIIFVLLSGCFPFHSDNEELLKKQIANADYTFPAEQWGEISDLARDLVKRLLVIDPSRRLTARQALQHPWLQDTAVANKFNLRGSIETYTTKRKRNLRDSATITPEETI